MREGEISPNSQGYPQLYFVVWWTSLSISLNRRSDIIHDSDDVIRGRLQFTTLELDIYWSSPSYRR